MIPARFRIKIEKILHFTLLLVLSGLFIKIYEHLITTPKITVGILHEYQQTASYSFSRNLIIAIATTFTAGIIFGTWEIIYFKEKLKKYSFGCIIVIKSIVYFLMILAIAALASMFYNAHLLQKPFYDDRVWFYVGDFLTSAHFLGNLLYFGVVIVLILFIDGISDKFGPGELLRFFFGKYHRPREEERIFMFFDMESSTTIAEKLGHERFYNLVNDVFADITDLVIYANGEIYKYMGDEMIVSWRMEQGLHNADCLQCFFAIQECIESNAETYKQKYGFIPHFKAGLHCGRVIIGELGVVKQTIEFSGDVLNTTARIQGQCNQFHKDILISADLLNQLPQNQYCIEKLGEIALKGKSSSTSIYTVSKILNASQTT